MFDRIDVIGIHVLLAGALALQPPTVSAGTARTLASDVDALRRARDLCLTPAEGTATIDGTLRTLQAAARALPGTADPWILLGRSWVRKARASGDDSFYANGQGCADVALDVEPAAAAPALGLVALAQLSASRFREARDTAARVLATAPEDTVALGILSDAQLELGDFDAAAAAAQRMLDVRPDMASYSRASYLRWLQGDRENAKRLIRSALGGRNANDPEPAAWTFVQAGALFWHEGDYEGADAVYAKALEWMPDYPAALVGRGRIALGRGDAAAATSFLQKAHAVRPLPETAWLLGDARDLAGDDNGARAAYESVLASSSRADALVQALFLATRNKDVGRAQRLLDDLRGTRGGVEVDDAIAWTAYRAGRLEEARSAIDRALSLGTPNARLLFHAGAIRLASGDRSGRALLERALALNPQFDRVGVAEARALLAQGH